ncbi:MAG: glycosyltransferase [Streptosporangiaceae bacterium]
MRVLLVHNRYRSAAPSGENRVVDTEHAALAACGHQVMLFGRRSDEIESWPRLKKASLPVQVVWSRQARHDLAAAIATFGPDVVHVHNTFPLLSSAVLYACRDTAVPVVATLHNYKLACASGDFFRDGAVCHECARRLPGPAVRHGCYRDSRAATAPVAIAVSVHRRAWRSLVSAYICVSAAQRDLLAGLRLPSERVFVRHNLIPRAAAPGAVGEPAHAPASAYQPGYGLAAAYQPGYGLAAVREPVVVYAGRLDEAKGARVLMAGWDSYLRGAQDSTLRLVIAGAGPLAREVATWAASRPSVEMAGQLDQRQCAALMARARGVLLPSAWEETFGLVVVEAMAAGTPPIASGHGSFPELITPDVDGVLFTPGDPAALGRVLHDVDASPGRFARYGAQARRTYERRFDPERSIEDLLSIYNYARGHPLFIA